MQKMSQKLKNYFDFFQVIVFSLIVIFISGAFLDWYKSIFLGIFIFMFYYTYEGVNKFIKESHIISPGYNGIFNVKLYAILAISLFLLGIVSLISSYISSKIDYCDKDIIYYSEIQCKLHEVNNKIYESYSNSYDNYDSSY